ncbi:hypothetical protein LSG31_06390 [Fodinisporobacter ferrooxydans]|uniref:Uncharacterized protein n=1 Tax=Fodinisporobacter ferrooxydans TaxID=2901836 RepID=A0ABY4CPG5_9BACL|nr:hypothetical protein LSG31_06390 [Alicyclobacillaceae bacterium MYW30-H2]
MLNETVLYNFLQNDREDVLAILQMRFGGIPLEIENKIEEISDVKTLERLILVAANAATWDVFVSELEEGKDAFRMVGEAFNPVSLSMGGEYIWQSKIN